MQGTKICKEIFSPIQGQQQSFGSIQLIITEKYSERT